MVLILFWVFCFLDKRFIVCIILVFRSYYTFSASGCWVVGHTTVASIDRLITKTQQWRSAVLCSLLKSVRDVRVTIKPLFDPES